MITTSEALARPFVAYSGLDAAASEGACLGHSQQGHGAPRNNVNSARFSC